MMKEEVKKLNQHLPKARKTLKALLDERTPSVESLDGRSIVMKRDELEKEVIALSILARLFCSFSCFLSPFSDSSVLSFQESIKSI